MSRFSFCAFDAYGTLFDLGSVVERSAARLGEKGPRLLALWRQKQLEATWLRSLMRRHAPFELLDGFRTVAPYPDVRPTLEALRRDGVRCAVLSNGTPAMLSAALAASGLAGLLDPVLSVESVGIYKPDPRVYALLESATGLPRRRIAFVSSNRWDVAGASAYGLAVVWANRAGARDEPLPGKPLGEVSSLSQLPALQGA